MYELGIAKWVSSGDARPRAIEVEHLPYTEAFLFPARRVWHDSLLGIRVVLSFVGPIALLFEVRFELPPAFNPRLSCRDLLATRLFKLLVQCIRISLLTSELVSLCFLTFFPHALVMQPLATSGFMVPFLGTVTTELATAFRLTTAAL